MLMVKEEKKKSDEYRKLGFVCRAVDFAVDFCCILSLQSLPKEKRNLHSHLITQQAQHDGREGCIANSALWGKGPAAGA